MKIYDFYMLYFNIKLRLLSGNLIVNRNIFLTAFSAFLHLGFRPKKLFKIMILYTRNLALLRTFHTSFLTTNSLFEFTTPEHKFIRRICTYKPVLNIRFKDFYYTKINPTQICNDEFISIIG